MEINQKVYQLSGKSNLCRESSFTFSVVMHSRKSGKCTEDAGVQCGIISTVLYRCCRRNGDTFTLGILNSYWMKQLVRQLAATRKPWTRFYGITVYFPLQYVAARLAITRQAAFSTNWNRA